MFIKFGNEIINLDKVIMIQKDFQEINFYLDGKIKKTYQLDDSKETKRIIDKIFSKLNIVETEQ